MHFSGRTWRPPYEAQSCILQLTAGCTYRRCRFCSLYASEPFRLSPMEEFEADLAELKQAQPYARRVFLTGGNPFALSYAVLKPYLLAVREYLIQCRSIAMFASVCDILQKQPWQLRKLRAMGVNGLTIGTESADDEVLALAGKGYTAGELLAAGRMLDEAGIEYYFVYMTGLAGQGCGRRNARNTAAVFNRLNPYIIGVDSLTLLPGTALYDAAHTGAFHPAGERERLEELMLFLQELQIRTHIEANTVTNFYPFSARLPYDRAGALAELQGVLDRTSEEEMRAYRAGLHAL